MDHGQIAEQNVIERYLMGQLTPEEEELFEEHLLECQDCRRQVEWEEDFQNSLHTVAAAEAARAAVVRVGLLAWLARHRAAGWLLTAAALLLVALPATWLLREQGKLRGQIAQLEAAVARRPPQPIPTPKSPEPSLEQRALEAELRIERDARTRLAEQIARLTQPQVNTPIVSLGLVRGETPPTRLSLGRDPGWIVLSVELPAEEASSYRATLATAAGRTVWKGEGLKAGADGTVALSFYSTLLVPGAYKLRLEAVDAQGHGSPAGEIPFQVAR
jgi:hypothetical protein